MTKYNKPKNLSEDELRELIEAEAGYGTDDNQMALFETKEFDLHWRHWKEMPEYEQEDQTPEYSLKVNFKNYEDLKKFSELVEQNITKRTPSIWYPKKEWQSMRDYVWVTDKNPELKYPVYIPSKNRSDTRLTARTFDWMGIDYKVVIEPSQVEAYSKVFSEDQILVLPEDDMGLPYSRNWIMEHSIENGHEKHWQFDDNIRYFYRVYKNRKWRVRSSVVLKIIEDFCDRYNNIAQAGMEYEYFFPRIYDSPPYRTNTRIYSNYLINNNLLYRFRGFYNDDTDFSLQCLKGGWGTVLFQAFICGKTPTHKIKGGLTEDYMASNERFEFAKELQERHPDVTKIVRRYGRWHHEVDYSPFKENKLGLKPDLELTGEPDNYGMKLVDISDLEDTEAEDWTI